jgi:hypothetical protein
MPTMSDIAPLLMGEGEVDAVELDEVGAVVEAGLAVPVVMVPVLVPEDVDIVDVAEVVVPAVTEKSPLCAYTSLMLLLSVASRV